MNVQILSHVHVTNSATTSTPHGIAGKYAGDCRGGRRPQWIPRARRTFAPVQLPEQHDNAGAARIRSRIVALCLARAWCKAV